MTSDNTEVVYYDTPPQSFTLSQRTLKILRKLSTINPSLLFMQGKELRTVSPEQDIMVVAKIEDEIPRTFGIYDLTKFLRIIAVFDDPVLTAHENYLEISSPRPHSGDCKYYYASPHMILLPPEDDFEKENVVAEFELPREVLQLAKRRIKIIEHPEIAFVSERGELSLRSADPSGANLHSYRDVLKTGMENDFHVRFTFKKINMLMPATYKVTLGDVCFFETDDGITYCVAPQCG